MARMAERDSRVTVRKCSPSRSERLRHSRTSTLLVDADRFSHHVFDPALARWRGHAAPLRRLPAHRRLHRNIVSTIGAFVLGISVLPFTWNVFKMALRRAGQCRRPVGLRQLAGMGEQLPAAGHNFTERPRIRSERPAFELHYPHMVERMRAEAHIGRQHHPPKQSR
jgi:hypothetical protein